MKLPFSLILMIGCVSAFAEHFESKIHSIDPATKQTETHLIKFENGRVIQLDYKNRHKLNYFKKSLRENSSLAVETDNKNNLLEVEVVEDGAELVDEEEDSEALMSYEPTTVPSVTAAATIFSKMRRNYQSNSQCYNRAHIWTYEEFKRSGLQSLKLFLFFTSRYIRNYNYHWWFHVSPMVSTPEGDQVLDRRYTSGPRLKDTWTKNFIRSGRKCPVINKYYDYRNNQQSEDCYLIAVSMYFWQPRDIERRDRTGHEKSQYYTSEINHSYGEAF